MKTAPERNTAVNEAIDGMRMDQIQKFVELCEKSGFKRDSIDLGMVQALFHGACGGFNQASWETQRITNKTTLEQLIEKMRCSDWMRAFVTAFGLIENAAFYAHLCGIFRERIELLVSEFGEDFLYEDIVAKTSRNPLISIVEEQLKSGVGKLNGDGTATVELTEEELEQIGEFGEQIITEHCIAFMQLIEDGFPVKLWVNAKKEFYRVQQKIMPKDNHGHAIGIDDLLDMIAFSRTTGPAVHKDAWNETRKELKRIKNAGINWKLMLDCYESTSELPNSFPFTMQTVFEIIESAEYRLNGDDSNSKQHVPQAMKLLKKNHPNMIIMA